MRALLLSSHTNAPKVEIIPNPVAKTGQVILSVEACGLNFADLLMAKGTYQATPKPPFILGMEVCGTVIAHGPGVSVPAIGTRVAVFGGQGGLAEKAAFPATLCQPVPAEMPSDVAAGFMVAYGTSHLALTHRARLQSGETLLVLGASGGVGLTAVEIGKALGATVIAVARGADKLAVAKAAGADHLINSETDDIRAAVKALGGADVVYDPVGGDQFNAALRACNREARIIVIGFASGQVPPVPANIIMVKNITVIGFYWGGYLEFAPDLLTRSLAEFMEWYRQGRLKPHISHVFTLENAVEALDMLRSRKATGKIVVKP